AALVADLLGQSRGQEAAQRLALLLAVDDGLVQRSEPAERPGLTGAGLARQRDEELVDGLRDGRGRGVLRGRDRLDRAAFGHLLQQGLLVGGEPADAGDGM